MELSPARASDASPKEIVLPTTVDPIPHLTSSQAIDLSQRLYGIEVAEVGSLPSYYDQNFHVKAAEGKEYILKINNLVDSQKPLLLEVQSQAMNYLRLRGLPTQEVLRNTAGQMMSLEHIDCGFGRQQYLVRLLSFLPGVVIAEIPASPEVLYQVGKIAATMNKELQEMVSLDRSNLGQEVLFWSLSSMQQVEDLLYVMEGNPFQDVMKSVMEDYKTSVQPKLGSFQKVFYAHNQSDCLVAMELSPARASDASPKEIVLPTTVDPIPHLTSSQAIDLSQRLYGIEVAEVGSLPSYYDQNFHVKAAEGKEYILKINNLVDSQKPLLLEVQSQAMNYLRLRGLPTQEVLRNTAGQMMSLEHIDCGFGRQQYLVRLLSFLPGVVIAEIPASPEVLYQVGKIAATMNKELQEMVSLDRSNLGQEVLFWSLSSMQQVEDLLYVMEGNPFQDVMKSVMEDYKTSVQPKLGSFQKVFYAHNQSDCLVAMELSPARASDASPKEIVLPTTVDPIPHLTSSQAIDLSQRLYGIEVAEVGSLPSYYDQNFHVKAAEGKEYILKINNLVDSQKPLLLEVQSQAMNYLRLRGLPTQEVLRNTAGQMMSLEHIDCGFGRQQYLVRLLSFLPGVVIAEIPASPEVLYQVGKIAATMNKELQEMVSLDRSNLGQEVLFWSLSSMQQVEDLLYVMEGNPFQDVMKSVMEDYKTSVQPKLGSFQKGIIHGDLNDHNVIVRSVDDDGVYEVSGVLDFGLLSIDYTLFDVVPPILYNMLKSSQPMDVGGAVLAGWESVMPLSESERDALYVLVLCRLCQSLVKGRHMVLKNPENRDYLLATSENGYRILSQLWQMGKQLVENKWFQDAEMHAQKHSKM